jgi:hypothetical protein
MLILKGVIGKLFGSPSQVSILSSLASSSSRNGGSKERQGQTDGTKKLAEIPGPKNKKAADGLPQQKRLRTLAWEPF